MECNNYFPIEKISLRYKYFCFIDTKEYLADELFITQKIRVWFQNEAHKPNTDYVFVFCKVKKSDVYKFLEVMEKLSKKMILLGHSDYQTFCQKFQENFLEQKEKA